MRHINILFCCLVWLLFGQILQAKSQRCAQLEALTRQYHNEGNYDSAYHYGQLFLAEAALQDDDCSSLVDAHELMGLVCLKMKDNEESVYHLDELLKIGQQTENKEVRNKVTSLLHLISVSEFRTMENRRKNIQLAEVALVALLCIIGLLVYIYVQKNRMYLAIVRQNHEAIKREKETEAIEKTSSQLDATKQDLLKRLEALMREGAYRENLITREKVADILETNRTYLGQLMNEFYKKSFTQYINDLRIDEAIRILDNPESKRAIRLIGLDLGFNSVTTFNAQFKRRTGMTPAQYRSEVVKLAK